MSHWMSNQLRRRARPLKQNCPASRHWRRFHISMPAYPLQMPPKHSVAPNQQRQVTCTNTFVTKRSSTTLAGLTRKQAPKSKRPLSQSAPDHSNQFSWRSMKKLTTTRFESCNRVWRTGKPRRHDRKRSLARLKRTLVSDVVIRTGGC